MCNRQPPLHYNIIIRSTPYKLQAGIYRLTSTLLTNLRVAGKIPWQSIAYPKTAEGNENDNSVERNQSSQPENRSPG